MRILIAGGGSGGHIHPALAVARALREGPAPVELAWVGGRRGLERELVPAAGFPLTRLWLRSLRSTELSVHAVLDPLRLGASLPQALALLTRLRPAAIFSTGGYVALPVLAAAATLRIPTLLWEGNFVPGRSARVAAPLATAITLSFEATRRRLGGRGELTGTPIRSLAGIDRADARERFGVAAGPALSPHLRRLAGRGPLRRRGGGGPAHARRTRRRAPPDRRAGLRGGAPAARGACRRTCATATGRTPSCARRWVRPWWPPTWSSGAPAPRPWPR